MACDEWMILHLISRMNGERTLSGIFHLLRGKRSSQSIQDSYLFHLRPFFHLLDGLSREEFDRWIDRVMASKWIEKSSTDEEKYKLSMSGSAYYRSLQAETSLPAGLAFTEWINDERLFWLKLQLLVQTVSELGKENRAFVPVTRAPQATEAVRTFLTAVPPDDASLSKRLKGQICWVFSRMETEEANLLAGQFSGHLLPGLTLDQMADVLHKEKMQTQLLFKAALRTFMHLAKEGQSAVPDLVLFFGAPENGLSQSAAKTYSLLQGVTIGELAERRGLARGTIEDHLIEITLKIADFNWSSYLSEPVRHRILEIAGQLKTKQLKPIKAAAGEQISFFQIRLALASESVKMKNREGGRSRENK
ncbi:MAG: helix-turn-helix domain-containing protein [Sporolactobacillus sp.]